MTTATQSDKISILYIDRITKKRETEQVYGAQALHFLYGEGKFNLLSKPLLKFVSKNPLFSQLFGFWQKQPRTKRNILPFIQKYGVDASEFLDPVDAFPSFNDFFIRKLKTEARPIAPGENVAIIPADGRYYFYQHLDRTDGFIVKGEKFCLSSLLEDEALAAHYEQGSMVIARLCPTDYHRYHFPVDCTPSETRLINGWLYSVNPIALRKNIHIFTQNKRCVTVLDTEKFGKVLFVEIGATSVGSMIQTYEPNKPTRKGAEKGYFSFGASSLILLFEPNTILFDEDLVAATGEGLEMRCLLGQSLGCLSSREAPHTT